MIYEFTTNSLPKIIHISDADCPEYISLDESSTSFRKAIFDIVYINSYDEFVDVLHKNQHIQIDAIVTQSTHGFRQYSYVDCITKNDKCLWWHWDDYDSHANELYYLLMSRQIDSQYKPIPTFSIIVPLYNTKQKYLEDLIHSILSQSYKSWELVLYDDSPNELVYVADEVTNIDPRIRYYRLNEQSHGNIGLSKHIAFSLSTGKWLIELDHDDMLDHNCLIELYRAQLKYTDSKFMYSDYVNVDSNGDGIKHMYGMNYSFGWGNAYSNGIGEHSIDINATTIRHIVGVPNHVRCWERNLYFLIGGHNINMRIADDYELLIRTFLHTKFTKIGKILYKQRFDGNNSQDNSMNRGDIQNRVNALSHIYNKQIHDRIIELGGNDPYYHEDINHNQICNLGRKNKKNEQLLLPLNYII